MGLWRGEKKGALFFTIDTMLAALMFAFTVVVVLSFFFSEQVTEDITVVLNNYNDYVANTKMETFVTVQRDVYTDARSAKPDLAVYEQVAYLVNTGQEGKAESFVSNVTSRVLPEHFGVQYSLDDTVVYSSGDFDASVNISSVLLTYFIDKDGLVQGPNVTRISIWI